MEVEKQVQQAATLIARLRAEDTDFRVFGAESHRYRLGSTLSEEELRAFETRHQIELPPDYRLYLKTVGNGNGNPLPYVTSGAGPYYGIYRVEETVMGDRTSEPFPFDQQAEIEGDLMDLWDENIPGLLELGTQGCAGTMHLVVNGTTYGTIWEADSRSTFWPTNLSFTEWICDWAQRCIPRVIQERVTNPVQVGMSLKEVEAICGNQGQRPYSVDTLYRRILRFEGLATQFELDERDVVIRIIRHSI